MLGSRHLLPIFVALLAACGGSEPSGPSTGSLAVAVTGLPSGTSADVTVTGPGGYARELSGSETLFGLAPGAYTVTAQAVSSNGQAYRPSQGTQSVTVEEGATPAAAGVSYAPGPPPTGFNLRIDGMYLTQSVQTYDGSVPLVKDRDGYLRIFVTASETNVAAPTVRVRFFNGGVLALESTIPAPGLSVPLSPDEGILTSSWNLPVPKGLIQPNLSILAEVDPPNTVAESDESDNAFPASGTPLPMDVRTSPTFSVRMVPIIQSVNGRKGDVTNANKDAFLTATMGRHPIATYDVDLRAPFTTSEPAVDKDNTNDAWTRILSELDALRTADGSSRHYFGVVNPSYTSGVAGVGYIGGKSALGWDRNGADQVAAHEWGHNWGRRHAPCGGAGNPDPNYPYADGTIGVYGLDVQATSLKPPTSSDLMGYCGNEWISDYTYRGVLGFRGPQSDVAAPMSQAMQPCLLVWGRIVNGRAVLEPAFQVVTRPSLPSGPGAYSVEGNADDGSPLFRLSFTPEEVADDPRGNRHFAFAVPLHPDRAARLTAMRLSAPGHPEASVRATGGASPDARSGVAPDIRATRAGPGRVSVRWDAAVHPVIMVRDPSTGQVLSFARGGQAEVATERDDLDFQLSNGVGVRSARVAVPAR